MILKRLRDKKASKIIKKQSGELRKIGHKSNRIKTVAIVINYDVTSNLGDLYKMTKRLNVQDSDVRIIGYTSKKEANKEYPIEVFSSKSFGWNGTVKDDDLNHFLMNDFDLLINYYAKANTSLLLVSSLVKADFRVGLGSENKELNHLILEIDDNSIISFMDEIVKYLTILNRI